jgi:hypothetical protein
MILEAAIYTYVVSGVSLEALSTNCVVPMAADACTVETI